MKAINLAILFMCLISRPSTVLTGGTLRHAGVEAMIRSTVSTADTSEINTLIRRGFMLIKKTSGKQEGSDQIAKAGDVIDSISRLCDTKKIEYPPLFHLLKAYYMNMKGDYSVSEEEAKIAEEKSVNRREYMAQAKALIFLGQYYHHTGFFQQSIEHYQKAIIVANKEKLKGIIPGSYNGLAGVYNTIGDLSGYRNNLRAMTDAGFEENDTRSAARALYLLGTSFCGDSATAQKRNYRKADSLLKRGLEISLVRKDTAISALALANLGWNFYLEKTYDSSLYHYEKSLKYSIPAKLYSYASNALGNIGTIYRDLGNSENAINFYQKAIDQAKKVNDMFNLQWIYMDMSNMYLMLEDTANAYLTYVQFKKYSDKWIKSENIRGITDAGIRYEADAHNKEVALLSLRLKHNRILNFGFAVLIMLTVAIGWLILRGIKLDDRRRMSEMNHKISELTQANLRQQMNPHFIFNTLNSIQYFMYQNDKLATNTYLTKFANLMRKILDNSSKPSVPLQDEIDALTLYLDLERLRFKDKFRFEINIDEEIDPQLYKVPTMLMQPYVENSICHGLMPKDGNGIVKINMKLQNNHIICTIEDNGIGRKAAMERKKMKDPNHNSMGTRIVSSRLELVNSLYGTSLQTVYTDLENMKGEPEGTKVEIHIPLMT